MEAAHTFERAPDEGAKTSEAWAIVKLKNTASGVPVAIAVEGHVKCISCGSASETLICDDCRKAITLVRGAGNLDVLKQLLDFASQPGMLRILQILASEDVVAEIMMKRIKDARSNRD